MIENWWKGYKEALSKNPHESPEAFGSYGAPKNYGIEICKLVSWHMANTSQKKKDWKNIFALVLPYAVFHEELEKKYDKILKQTFTLPPRPWMWIFF
jgi:hypothetical protein